jgi:MFS transporter, DHA1 family, inner membrane transport protein
MPLAILALTAAAFGIGTTEFVIMGLLPDVARDLAVDIPKAGMLVSGYALGVFVGAPILAIATAHLPRKMTLLALMAIFIAGNLFCALAPSYSMLLAARIVTAFCHGAFFGIGAVVAAELAPPNKKAQAMALMFAGLTLANVLGVPFGTALGQAMGWRATFWAVVGLGVIAAMAIAALVPAKIKMEPGNILREFRVLGKGQVLFAMIISALASASLFSVFTYITPILEQVTGLPPHWVTIALLLFGVGLTVGNLIGGRLADWKLMPSVVSVLVVLIGVLSIFIMTSHWAVAAMVTTVIWGILAFALVPLLQMRVVNEARQAPNLASTLNQGAFNLGNAAGAWAGGSAIAHGIAYDDISGLGAAIALAALLFSVWSGWLDRLKARRRSLMRVARRREPGPSIAARAPTSEMSPHHR